MPCPAWLFRLLLAGPAFGRAGGGENYSGGGRISDSFSGMGSPQGLGGSGSGDSDFLLALAWSFLRWAAAHPMAGIPLCCVILYCVYAVYRQGSERYVSVIISRGARAQAGAELESGLAGLRGRDPGFSPEAFLARARDAFLKIQQAWCGQDLAPVRAFISDGVLERFSIQLARQKALGRRDRMDQVRVLDSCLVAVAGDAQFDSLHVSLRASAVDAETSLADGSLVGGGSPPEEFTEVWSFLRRPGAKTLARPGLIEGLCPNCGAALPVADAALCSSCGSWVSSGQYDWVLSEITQACEWRAPVPGRRVPGWEPLAAADPGLNAQFLEDRASVLFWRWQQALWESSPASLAGVASDEFCSCLARSLPGQPSRPQGAEAVGEVSVLALEPGEPLDRAHVLVKWSAEQCLRQHVLILGRRSGVKTDARSGLVSLRCPGCGAPPQTRDAARCAYCGLACNDGSRGWVLLDVVPIGLWKPPQAGAAQAAPAPDQDWGARLSPLDALAVLAAAMSCDRSLEAPELASLESYAQRRGIPADALSRVLAAAAAGAIELPQPQDAAQARAMLGGLIRMSLADGRLSEAEMRLLQAFASRHGLGPDLLTAALREERQTLLRQAKAS